MARSKDLESVMQYAEGSQDHVGQARKLFMEADWRPPGIFPPIGGRNIRARQSLAPSMGRRWGYVGARVAAARGRG